MYWGEKCQKQNRLLPAVWATHFSPEWLNELFMNVIFHWQTAYLVFSVFHPRVFLQITKTVQSLPSAPLPLSILHHKRLYCTLVLVDVTHGFTCRRPKVIFFVYTYDFISDFLLLFSIHGTSFEKMLEQYFSR